MKPLTVVFYKPFGVVSQFTPLGGHKTLAGFSLPQGLYPAGRLDADSEGLLILTSDGDLQRRITDPRFGHPRTYLAQVERVPSTEALRRLQAGLKLKDGMTRPFRVRALSREPSLPARVPPIRARKTVPTAWLELTLTEGRNRQVRRMTAAIGHPTLRLVRIKSGTVTLRGLKPGEWRELQKKDLGAP